MLIWANKKEINQTIIKPLAKIYKEKLHTRDLKNILKAWELSVILRQIRRHFGYKKSISILDFGTGISPFPAYLEQSGYKNVTCLDQLEGRYRWADQTEYNKLYGSSVTYIKTDKIKRSLGLFDVIYSASVLEHILDKNERIQILKTLARHLELGGLFIHVIDYKETLGKAVQIKNVRELIDGCDVPISRARERTPGCRQFIGAPSSTWWDHHRKATMMTRIAFFNERENEKA